MIVKVGCDGTPNVEAITRFTICIKKMKIMKFVVGRWNDKFFKQTLKMYLLYKISYCKCRRNACSCDPATP